ncbi:MAG TPA: ABC transporter substrate-binding protein, partial [Pyrinomonadaceae bacterium]|nr:ABC transporter substrate-binding protein [Pyrinomonadaceae bacterium]
MKLAIRQSSVISLSLYALYALLHTLCPAAGAQQAGEIRRIGYLGTSSVSDPTHALRQGLHDLGHVEGKNIIIEYRYTEGETDRLPNLAAELVRLKVDVIVVQGTVSALIAKKQTSTIPIVMTYVGDPVSRGLFASLARPGGNVTGLTSASPDLTGKRLELFKETVPRLSRVGVLWSSASQGSAVNFKETEAAGRSLAVQIQSLEVRSSTDFDNGFKAATNGAQGLVVLEFTGISSYRKRIVELAIKSRLPTMFAQGAHVEAGGLMYYGPNF